MAGSQEGKSRGAANSSVVSTECIYELFEHCFKTPYKASSNDRKVRCNKKVDASHLKETKPLMSLDLGGHYPKKMSSFACQGL